MLLIVYEVYLKIYKLVVNFAVFLWIFDILKNQNTKGKKCLNLI